MISLTWYKNPCAFSFFQINNWLLYAKLFSPSGCFRESQNFLHQPQGCTCKRTSSHWLPSPWYPQTKILLLKGLILSCSWGPWWSVTLWLHCVFIQTISPHSCHCQMQWIPFHSLNIMGMCMVMGQDSDAPYSKSTKKPLQRQQQIDRPPWWHTGKNSTIPVELYTCFWQWQPKATAHLINEVWHPKRWLPCKSGSFSGHLSPLVELISTEDWPPH